MISLILIFVYILFPFVVRWWCRKKKIPAVIGFGAALIVGYIVYVGISFIYGMELERDMYRYDLDGDRGFSESELTEEAKVAMKKWSSDTGRTLVPIVAAPVTLIWVGLVYSIMAVINWIIGRLSKRKAVVA